METVALVTGCSSAVGRATAEAFVVEGWTVYAAARDAASVEDLGERGCEPVSLNATDDADVERVVDRVLEEAGRIDCLVTTVGPAPFGAAEDVPPDLVRGQFEVNAVAPHRLARAVLPQMRERGDGTIVNVSSAAGWLPIPGLGGYCGSTAALEAMTDALRAELRPHGVDAVLVEPGIVETAGDDADGDDGRRAESDRTAAYDSLYGSLDNARVLRDGGPGTVTPERVADAVVNAASATRPDSRYPVGPVAKFARLARLLPDGVRDGVFGLARRL